MNTTPYNLYKKRGARIKFWKRIQYRGTIPRRQIYKYHSEVLSIPKSLHKATINRINNSKVQVTGYDAIITRNQTYETPQIWGSPEILSDSLIATPSIKQRILTVLHNGTLYIVSDGLYYESYRIGSTVWFIDNDNK